MKDTAFYQPEEKAPRIANIYTVSPAGLGKQETPAWLATRTLFSGGGGLWSTADDYLQFAQMLVNGGELNGKRLLSPRTVDLMSSNHVGGLFAASSPARAGMGFGLTVEVVVDQIAANRRDLERLVRLGRRLRHALLGGSPGTDCRPAADSALDLRAAQSRLRERR
mgnify:CR=1 FL=1